MTVSMMIMNNVAALLDPMVSTTSPSANAPWRQQRITGRFAATRAPGHSDRSRRVTINATGTFAMDYPGFIDDAGAQDRAVRKQVEATLRLGRLTEPAEAAHFVATLIDGVALLC